MGRFDNLHGDEDELEAERRQQQEDKWERQADEEE